MLDSGLRTDILLSDSINLTPNQFQVWIHILLNVGITGVSQFSYSEISEKRGIPKTSVYRAIEELTKENPNYNYSFISVVGTKLERLKKNKGVKIECSIISNKTLIKVIDYDIYLTWNENGTDKTIQKDSKKRPKVQKDPNPIYKQFIDIYDTFVIDRTSCPGIYNGREGDAANGIIAYLKTASNDKTDDGILKSWEFMLKKENWDKLDNYNNQRLKLSQILENIPNILNQIRNGAKKGFQAKPTISDKELSDHIDKVTRERGSYSPNGEGAGT